MSYNIEKLDPYAYQIGHLVSMMNYVRVTTLEAVENLSIEQLDYLPHGQANSIGALLYHIAAVEFGFQIEIFEGRQPSEKEISDWGAAYDLGDLGRKVIREYPLDFYIKKLNTVRERTLRELSQKDDSWLYEERLWDNQPSNNYFIWFHVFEDEINHRGQIRIIRKMIDQ
ncbi:DinB family protein [Tenuibacillus multivorans]|uniref:Uncharacterized damage-inducible protein DinB (Forms a four-helix bundle) n=1 Tax=Tenuibacillus multivorans TaxID=237069 RepID=A0A1H0AMJ0_9BACI|nr:DinB family protein [Tenuibacillus multivorans]GEL78200.1 integrase [Tenuibacillus multivorans]SDN34514.1 Uncharacterized damage-inducible protein DinB (forms a four-helix bundle) [Tenuibacillus multivorans]